GRISYPAYLKGIIGVKADIFDSCFQYYYNNGFFHAPLSAEGIPGFEEIGYKLVNGTSISSAYITGHVANILYETNYKDAATVKKLLISNSIKQ
ncbi:MAG: S8 family serine peptidase, partial [Peptococcaceae bacterium]|nr:S8 family serine peptidase [Peptococcaceae bacterium]